MGAGNKSYIVCDLTPPPSFAAMDLLAINILLRSFVDKKKKKIDITNKEFEVKKKGNNI